MEDSKLRAEASDFFDAFVSAFQSFDGTEIARRYAVPYAALHADGSVECFESPHAIAAYLQRVVDSYREKGCRSCRFCDLEVLPLGQQCTLATVNWELLDERGKVLRAWRESYSLRHVGSSLQIFASVDHAR
ncbi:hypothetical protein QTH97_23650 [Variovorax sp. J22R24]|uniref:hypothetical protein n=1 Tax=Variovorax gracilis TaxID=3053502 RepID=UPI0025765DA2|nr:hypothetical protein [Variovorax sp. J22R24]MDM0107963.1 hypothetical protein [Variovorax sp. J22R24]